MAVEPTEPEATPAGPDTHGVVVTFGKYRGTRLTRVPVSYLRWLANTVDDPAWRALAKAEIERRGSAVPQVDVSNHAIDSASLRVLDKWNSTRGAREGLHAWLCRMTLEALEKGQLLDETRVKYKGMKFAIERGAEFPVLLTVM